MFFTFLQFICSELEEGYSILRPIVQTNLSEVGNWTLRGSATNMKQFIRLTSPTNNDFGSLCQRLPTYFESWSFTIKLRSFGGTGGRGFWIFFSEELCPVLPTQWNGFSIWINSSSIDDEANSPIYFVKNNGTSIIMPQNYKQIGYVPIHNFDNPLILNIKKNNSKLSITKIINNNKSRILMHEENCNDIIKSGYFTVSSITSKTNDNNDIIEIKTERLPGNSIKLPNNLSKINRKKLESYVDERRKDKNRRRALQKTVLKYLEEIEKNNSTLKNSKKYNNQTQRLKDAFRMIHESQVRASSSISLEELLRFIDMMVDDKVVSAYEMFNDAFENFTKIKRDVNETWKDLKYKLSELSNQSKSLMNDVNEEVMKIYKNLTIFSNNPLNIIPELKKEAQKTADNYVTKILHLVALIELVLYIIFFIYQRTEKHGFKKND